MRKLLFMMISLLVGLTCVSCNSKIDKVDERKIYDQNINEFFVYNIPISKGAGEFMNKLLDDGCWTLSYLVNEDDWWTNPYLDYSIVHWCRFKLSDTIPVSKYVEINQLLFGNLPVLDTLSKYFKSCDTCTISNYLWMLSDTEIQLSWYQNGQINEIRVENYGLGDFSYINGYGDVKKQKEAVFDRIFPDKKVANRICGNFEFFDIKNVSVYITESYDEYRFKEVTNEKYNISLYDVLPKFKEYNNYN